MNSGPHGQDPGNEGQRSNRLTGDFSHRLIGTMDNRNAIGNLYYCYILFIYCWFILFNPTPLHLRTTVTVTSMH